MSSHRLPDPLRETLAAFHADGTPRTTTEVADSLGVGLRSAESLLDRLVDRDHLATRRLDGGVRVWWRPTGTTDATETVEATDATAPDPSSRSEPPVEDVLDRISDGLYALDERLRFTYVNDPAATLLGLAESEVVGRDVRTELFLTEAFEAALETALEGGEPVFLEDYYEPLGAWFENRIYPSASGVSVYFRDVSERKRLERELRTEREQFRVALRNSPIVAFRQDTELRYTWVYNVHEDFDETVVLGQSDEEILPLAAAAVVTAPKRRVLETGEGVRELVTYDLPSGEVTYDLTVEPLFDESGEVVGLTSAALDVTERERRERELRRQNERLDRFADVLSHDLRGPLAVASGRLHLLDAGDDENVAAIRRAHERIETIVDDVLTLAREGQPPDEVGPVSVRRSATTAWGQLDTRDATLTIDTDRAVSANESRLQRLFENLFRNSVEHGSTSPRSRTHEDSVEHGSTDDRSETGDADGAVDADTGVRIRVGDLADGSGFFVEDDGPGLPSTDRAHLFDYGYSTAAGGTGFGLAIVAAIVEAHGWTVTATEASGGGARFEIRDR